MSDRLLEANNAAIKSRSPNLECSQIILTDLSIAGITSVYTENFWVKHRILTFSVSLPPRLQDEIWRGKNWACANAAPYATLI